MTATDATHPPRLHWAIVLLLTVVTLGIFYIVWMFVQQRWIKRIDPESNAMPWLVAYVVLAFIGQIIIEASDPGSGAAVAGAMLILAGTACGIFGFFSQRRSLMAYYNRQLPEGLRLSPALTFILGTFYLQHHLTRIAKQQQ